MELDNERYLDRLSILCWYTLISNVFHSNDPTLLQESMYLFHLYYYDKNTLIVFLFILCVVNLRIYFIRILSVYIYMFKSGVHLYCCSILGPFFDFSFQPIFFLYEKKSVLLYFLHKLCILFLYLLFIVFKVDLCENA